MPDIAVVNTSKAVTQPQLEAWMPAFQAYVDAHLKPAWGVSAALHLVPKRKKADPKMWWMVVGDHSSQQGALGFHSDQPNGLPYSFIAAADDIRYGYSIPVTLTHELAEMLVDPMLDQFVMVGTRKYIKEVCDPCEADVLGLLVGGVLCSDFCLPSYYTQSGTGPFDAKGVLLQNISVPGLLPGGYISYQQNGVWHQITARLKATGEMGRRSLRQGRSFKVARG